MRLQTVYTITAAGDQPLDIKPFKVQLDDNIQASVVKHEGGLRLLIDRKVDPAKLKLITDSRYYRELSDGTHEPIPTLELADDEAPETVLSQDVASGLTFLTDTSVSLSAPPHQNRFVPETNKDRKLLKDFGTSEPTARISGQVSMRSFSGGATTETLINLMPRRAGLRLYANAIKANLAVAQFRELWRVLEAAFGKTDDELVDLITQYQPAKALGFDQPEIRRLLVLRGRASHAQSSSGIKELAYVDGECAKQLPRLKNLCERVILTKKSWGYPTLGTDELLPLAGFIGPSNSITVINSE